MLVLSRKQSERLILTVPPSDAPTVIEVLPVRIGPVSVKLGIDAPREVAIEREELRACHSEGN